MAASEWVQAGWVETGWVAADPALLFATPELGSTITFGARDYDLTFDRRDYTLVFDSRNYDIESS